MSYSQIKDKLDVSKSTLSTWLHEMPLAKEQILQLQKNERVIEKIRQTKLQKKLKRRSKVYDQVAKDIEGATSANFVAGFYLYWGEGTKTAEYTVSLTNSDPAMIHCFVGWMEDLGVKRSELKIKLHIYTDQEEGKLKSYWSKVTGIPIKNFYKTYQKDSLAERKTYKGMFPYGTCVVIYSNRDVYEYVMEGIRYLRNKYQP